jgi:pimeloyl-ACP methyl ester carboxylesterase
MTEAIDHRRRRAFGALATTVAVAGIGHIGAAQAQPVAPHPDPAAYAGKFSGRYAHRLIKGAGHNLPQEAPQAFADAVLEVAGWA